MTAPLELRSPASGRALQADTGHSLSDGMERWPLVDGIAFLRVGREDLVARVLVALDAGDRTGALVALLADQDDWARTAPPGADALASLVAEADRLTFREATERLALGGVATYFAHRWSDPTFLAGLALVEAHRGDARSAIEIACGAGHHLREMRRIGLRVAGGDVVFAKLWLARHWVAPEADLVCFDAAAPWPVTDGAFDLAVCHDALYFLPEKPHVAAEMRRTAGDVLVSHAHNRLVENLSAGEPLDPAGYAALFPGAWLYDDAELTRALVEARAPVARPADDLGGAAAVALAASIAAAKPVIGGVSAPSPGSRLVRNPLYVGGEVRWPSERYETEYGPLATYPRATEAPEEAVAGESVAVDLMARRRVLLDLPARW